MKTQHLTGKGWGSVPRGQSEGMRRSKVTLVNPIYLLLITGITIQGFARKKNSFLARIHFSLKIKCPKTHTQNTYSIYL